MKKALYIIFIMSAMGFTVAPPIKGHQEPKAARIIAPQSGYIEVSASTSYTLGS